MNRVLKSEKLQTGASKIIDQSLAIRKNERLVVVADQPNLAVGQALYAAGLHRGAEVSLMIMETRNAHAEDPPRPIAEALLHADAAVLATVFSLSNSEARRKAVSSGVRLISLPGCCEKMLLSGAIEADFEALKPLVEKIGALLSNGHLLTVESALGTGLRIRLCGHRSLNQTAMAREPGTWAPAPLIEAAVAPCIDGVDGILVVDGVVIPGGVPERPLEIGIVQGRVVAIEGGRDADRFSAFLASFDHPNLYQVVEVGIGLNPKSTMGRGLMAEDESQFGTIHLGVGEGRTFGLPVSAPSHADLVIRKPRVTLDGREILDNEKLSSDLKSEEFGDEFFS